MHRRLFVGSVLGSSLLAIPGLAASASKKRPKIGIVGGGIIGASIAVHLVEAGADVIIFEKNTPGSGATQASLAWINPSTVNVHYRDLRLESMDAWREMDRKLGLGVIWGGSVSWSNLPDKALNLQKREAALRGTSAAPVGMDESKIAALCPYIVPGETRAGFFLPNDGHIDPVDVTQRMLSHARAKGATLLFPCTITGVDMANGALKGVRTTKGEFALDHLVFAAGTDTPALMAMVGFTLEMRNAPGMNVWTRPIKHDTKMVFDFSSALEFKQMPNGQAVVIYVGGPPKLPVHEAVFNKVITDFPGNALAASHAQSLLSKASVYWPALAGAVPDRITVGYRPMPRDGLPIIGPVPGAKGVYVVATHSGVTLAPIMGRHTAAEVLGGARIAALAPYRPERFLAPAKVDAAA